jgi:hypothetical protein
MEREGKGGKGREGREGKGREERESDTPLEVILYWK